MQENFPKAQNFGEMPVLFTFKLCNFLFQTVNFSLKSAQFKRNRIGNVNLVDIMSNFVLMDFFAFSADNSRRNANSSTIIGDSVEDNGICGNFNVISNSKRAEDFCACTNKDIIAESRVALALILTCTAKSNSLIQQAVIAYYRCFTDNNSHTVVNEKSLSDSCAGVYLNTRLISCALRDNSRNCVILPHIEPMSKAI